MKNENMEDVCSTGVENKDCQLEKLPSKHLKDPDLLLLGEWSQLQFEQPH